VSNSPDDQIEAPDGVAREPASAGRFSRRKILGGLAAGGVALGIPAAASAQQDRRGGGRDRNGRDGAGRGAARGAQRGSGHNQAVAARFTRIFDEEQSFQDIDDELRTMLAELGAPGGILDANDPLEEGPIRLITELELSANNQNNPAQTAGSTFVGQFIDHDITRDAGSALGRRTSVRRSTNLRSARLDLDSVYGGGPNESPDLYRDDDQFLFRVESGGLFEDLPRDSDGLAIVADPRNDENLIVAGIQVAFLEFHNAVLAQVRSSGLSGQAAFDNARQTVVHHYQWLVLHQFLPQFVGQAMVDDILRNGRRHYTPTTATIPVEFQTSAYRFGHSLIRPSYRANLAGDDGEPFFGMVFDPAEFGQADPADMSGGHRAPRRFIGWQTFFNFGDGEVKPNKRIDTHLSTPLFQLPMGTIDTSRGEPIGPTSLATRNLLRHITWSIPSGQQVADQMGIPRIAGADLADIDAVAPRLAGSTPLWLYVLREADIEADGAHLGPVGGRIVGEVLIGLLEMDPSSILNTPGWRPTLDSASGTGTFEMIDLLTIASVDPVTRGQ
jgi:hypothetical protein